MPLLLVLLVVLVTAGVYAPVRGYDFVEFDDPDLVSRNAHVQRGLSVESIRWALTTREHAYWMLATWLSFMADWTIHQPRDVASGELRAGGYHLTNLALHLLNVLLLFAALRALTQTAWPSAIAAALFAVHPVHVESVAWVTERKDVLAMCFGLTALWAYARYARQGSWWAYGMGCIALALSLMAKPMLVTLPCVLLLLDVWPLRRLLPPGPPGEGRGEGAVERRKAANAISATHAAAQAPSATHPLTVLLDKLPLFALVGAASAITFLLQRGARRMGHADMGLSLADRLGNAAISYVRYLGHLVWPVDLAALYPHAWIVGEGYPLWQVAGAAVFVGGVTVAAIVVLIRGGPARFAAVGWLWFVGALLPMIGLVQVGSQAMADRFAYFPAVGVYIIVAWSLARGADRLRRVVPAEALLACAAVCMVVPLAWRTAGQVTTWRDSERLFTHALAVTQRNDRIHYRYASWLAQQARFAEAATHYRASLAIQSDPAAHNGYGDVLLRAGRADEAAAQFELALRGVQMPSDRARTFSNLAQARMAQGRFDDAVASYEAAIEMLADGSGGPLKRAELHRNAGIAAARGGRFRAARHHFEQGLSHAAAEDAALVADLRRLRDKAVASGG